MALNVAVQMDPIDKINVAGNSTFALLLEARAGGHGIFYYTPDKLSLHDGRVLAETAPVDVRDVKGDHFTLGEAARLDLSSMDVVLLRQDPPTLPISPPRTSLSICSRASRSSTILEACAMRRKSFLS
jgi:glutathione synthase